MADQTKLFPCLCGYSGRLDGTYNGWWHELKCPQCGSKVEAFTMEGMVARWQEKNGRWIVSIPWPDGPEAEEEFSTLELAEARVQEVARMPWAVEPPVCRVYGPDGEEVEPRQLTPTGRIQNHQPELQRLPSASKEPPEPKVMPAVDFSSLELRVENRILVSPTLAGPLQSPGLENAKFVGVPGRLSPDNCVGARQKDAGPGMTRERYNELRRGLYLALTEAEVAAGWYFDDEYDGLLVHESWEGHERERQ